MTHAIVSLQGLHLGDSLRCPIIPSGMGLKSFCPWHFKLCGNTEAIFIHLWEVHYQMAIVCDICQMFASMSAQNVLNHQAKYKAKCNKECTECKGHEKAKKCHKERKSK